MPPNRFLTGFDECGETELASLAVTRRSRRPRRELTDSKPKEVEPSTTTDLVERVANAGFARFQFQSHPLQPLGDQLLTFTHPVLPLMQDHEIVSVPHQEWGAKLL